MPEALACDKIGSWWFCGDISLHSDWDCGVSGARQALPCVDNLRQPMALRMDRMRKEQREERNRHGGLGCPTNRQLNNEFQISLDWCDGIICISRNSTCSYVSIGIRWLMSICHVIYFVSSFLFFVFCYVYKQPGALPAPYQGTATLLRSWSGSKAARS